MDAVRDLARVEPWRESLERSRARRCKPPGSIELDQRRRPQRDQEYVHDLPTYVRLCWQAVGKRWMLLILSAAGLVTLTLLAATRPGVSDGRGSQAGANAGARAVARSPHAELSRASVSSQSADTCDPVPGPGSARSAARQTRGPEAILNSYVNPLAGAVVKPERIDQGVDYAGSGTLTAIGAGRLTYLETSNTGWPGAFIEYQLLNGPEAHCYVYYAEGVTPESGLYVGEPLRAGQVIATIIPEYSSGIELGWGAGAGTEAYAAKLGEWSDTNDEDSIPTEAGKSFSALVASLGGPPGKVEG